MTTLKRWVSAKLQLFALWLCTLWLDKHKDDLIEHVAKDTAEHLLSSRRTTDNLIEKVIEEICEHQLDMRQLERDAIEQLVENGKVDEDDVIAGVVEDIRDTADLTDDEWVVKIAEHIYENVFADLADELREAIIARAASQLTIAQPVARQAEV